MVSRFLLVANEPDMLWRWTDKFERILMDNQLAAVSFGDLPGDI